MESTSMRVFSSCLIAFLATVAILFVLAHVARRFEWLVDKPEGRKRHQGAVPVVGGIAIYLGFASSMAAPNPVFEGLPWLMAGGLLVVGVGALDDYCPISAGWRFAAQTGAALLAIYGADVRLYDLGNLSLGGGVLTLGVFSMPFTVFSTVGVINALNLSDGTDGLAGTIAILSLLALMVMASLAGRYELFQISICLASAVTAFLLFNLPGVQPRRWRIFLGDAGSTLLGYLLACLLIASCQGDIRVFAPIIGLWLLAVPLADTVTVMGRRLASGRSPFRADRTHLHHLALSAGLSQRQTVLLLSAMGVFCISIGLAGWLFRVSELVLLCLFLAFSYYYFWWTGRAWAVRRFLGHTVCRRQQGFDRRSGKDGRQIATSITVQNGILECRRGDRRFALTGPGDGISIAVLNNPELITQQRVAHMGRSSSTSSATSRSPG
ncbi:MAG: MraY family glycosyltransferase [Gammaproteobacteria bacterium]